MSGTIQPAGTATSLISGSAAGVMPVSYGYYPREGSRCVTASYNWTSQLAYAEDLSQLVARGIETSVQTLFVDNSTCAQPVTLLILGSDQVLVVPPNSQGVYPVFFTGTPALTLSVPALSATVTRVYYLNVPISNAVWPVSFATGGGGSTAPLITVAGAGTATQGAVDALTYNPALSELTTGNSVGLQSNAYGSLYVDTEANSPTYWTSGQLSIPASQAIIFEMNGNGTKTLRIHQIMLSFTATSAPMSAFPVSITRRLAAAGGTSTGMGIAPHDTNSAASGSGALAYTAPGAGSTAAASPIEQFFAASATNAAGPYIFEYGKNDQSFVLRGSQTISISLENAAIPAGLVARLKMKWSEI